ncbi:MAG TPA: FTR1 family protein [Candidatus Thermoplasmatota archaeon]|nr:FTR1 family protein [Candidatus Thermoplasmatota archaeon]
MAALDPAAVLIGLREGLEALLVLGILLGLVRRFGHPEKQGLLWLGALAGVVASVAVGVLVARYALSWFEDGGGAALFEVVVALTAVAILTYMVVWMQKHTTDLLAKARRAAEAAATDGRWVVLASLTFVTVFREGLETVLFFAARSSQVSWSVLVVSGLVGFAISAAIAALVFGLTVKVDLKRFFGITGILLVFIAAGLLIHVAHAAADLGWIGHGEPLWDTSGALPDHDHWLGGPLHALFGYEDQPTALGLLLYLGYLVGVGGWYLSRLASPRDQKRARTAAVACAMLLLGVFAFAGAVPTASLGGHGHGHGGSDGHAHEAEDALASAALAARGRLEADGLHVGVLVRHHGEPVHYNATTYASFRAFVDGIWPYTGLPRELLQVDQGTVLIDGLHPFEESPRLDARYIDAWLKPYAGPAIPVSDPAGLHDLDGRLAGGQFYLAPGAGPGLGEGDIYEMVGLASYRTWLKMENESPMYAAVQAAWDLVRSRGGHAFGDRVTFAFAHHMDPKVDANETTEAAARFLADAGVGLVVDAYMSSAPSDAMDTCMMRPHTLHALAAAGYRGPVVHAGAPGTAKAWAVAAAAEAERLVREAPAGADVAVHLAQHGGDPGGQNPCGDGPERYHASTRASFLLARDEVQRRLPGVPVRQVYGQGADGPDQALSPMEALRLDRDAGVRHIIVLPYEFWGDAMDNLVPLREAYGLTPDQLPYYGPGHETRLTVQGVDVRIASAEYGMEAKVDALLLRIAQAITDAEEAAHAHDARAGGADHAHGATRRS